MWTFKKDARRVIANLVQVEGESALRYFKRTRQLLWDTNHENDCQVVKEFINGLIDDGHHRAMQATRRQNPSMTLLQAYEHLETLASLENGSDIGFNQNADKESSALESSMSRVGIDIHTIGSFPPHRTIAVQDIPGYILVDPAAFRQFLVMNNLQPHYQCSGRY